MDNLWIIEHLMALSIELRKEVERRGYTLGVNCSKTNGKRLVKAMFQGSEDGGCL